MNLISTTVACISTGDSAAALDGAVVYASGREPTKEPAHVRRRLNGQSHLSLDRCNAEIPTKTEKSDESTWGF